MQVLVKFSLNYRLKVSNYLLFRQYSHGPTLKMFSQNLTEIVEDCLPLPLSPESERVSTLGGVGFTSCNAVSRTGRQLPLNGHITT